jgi:outer membrane protein assembly factor BamB
MKNFTVACLVIILSACSGNSDWLQFRGEGGRGASSSVITPPLGIRWKIKLQSGDEKIDNLNPPVVYGDTIYFGSADGNFYALDAQSGYMRWVYKSGAEINSIPCADENNVYFGSKDGRVYALSRKTGEKIWDFTANSQINSQIERYKDYIIFVGDADAIYFLSPDGREQFNIYNPGWYHFTFLVSDDIMYFATGETVDLIGPYDIKQRKFLWYLPYRSMDAHWYSFPAVSGDLLYFGTAGMYDYDSSGWYISLGYYALNRHTGSGVWKQNSETKWSEEFFDRNMETLDFLAPTIWKNMVIYTGGDRAARAFDAKTGNLLWEHHFDTPTSSSPTIAGNAIYFGLMGGRSPPGIVCLRAQDGKFLWGMETEGALLSAPVIAGRRIIFGTDENVFYVLEQVF